MESEPTMESNALSTSEEGEALTSPESFGTPLSECDDVRKLRLIAEVLWGLLDDIDTSSDVFKPCESNPDGYRAFYRYAMERAVGKNTALHSDGYNLFLPKSISS